MLNKYTGTIEKARNVLLPCALVVACSLLLWAVHAHYPLQQWLFWRYLAYWLVVIFWALGCLNVGFHLTRRLGLHEQRASEVLQSSMALGVLAFALLMFAFGVVGLYHWPLFFILPAACLAFYPRPLFLYLRRAVAHLSTARSRAATLSLPHKVFGCVAVAYGIYCIVLLYLGVMNPENASYDARWYHLGIAEHYVAEGGIRPFVEGWYVGAYPHLASFLYTWAFLNPLGQLFDRVELCAHLEFALFLCTLPGIAMLAARVLKQSRLRLAWVALFLYPGILVYDSNLVVGADHIAAFWACPIYLAFLRTYRDGQVRHWLLLAALMAGALLTKYSAICLMAFPLLILGGRLFYWALFAQRQQAEPRQQVQGVVLRPAQMWKGPALAALLGLVLTACHWLCNWIWYNNPVYPYASGLFKSKQWSPFARELLHSWTSTYEWEPHGTFLHRVRETLRACFTFSFVPNDWTGFHGMVPVFGFLFTLGLLILPFVKGARRLWPLVIATQVGVFLWYWGMHQDRYLQLLIPWMAAGTAALIALLWRSGLPARVGLLVLVGLQVIWGADAFAIPSHVMLGRSTAAAAIDLISSGYKRKYDKRLRIFEPYRSIGLAVPDAARILLHESHMRTGLRVPVVSDWVRQQGGIDYGSMGSPDAIYHWTKSLGLTHVVWPNKSSSGLNSIAGDLLFFDFVNLHTGKAKRFGSFNLAQIAGVTRSAKNLRVTYLGCADKYASGLYDVTQLRVPGETNRRKSKYPKPHVRLGKSDDPTQLIEQSRYLAYQPACARKRLPKDALRGWKLLAKRDDGIQLWIAPR
ncbi:MAG TPA: hypothetical protein VL137_13230 [Polyangiaceae bacterium]|nr:hypothetical protein [Polyangiaceae bacterium]